MKIKKIASVCKKTKLIQMHLDNNDVQWIGNGYAMYPLFGLPIMSEENIFKIFDIVDKQAEKFAHAEGNLIEFCFDDNCENENILVENDITLIIADKVIKSYQTTNGIAFIDTDYLGAFDDMAQVDIYERIGAKGNLYFAIKVGLLLYGIIIPYECIEEKFVDSIKLISQQCSLALYNKNQEEL